jgi:Flp pilus assembly protein TadG
MIRGIHRNNFRRHEGGAAAAEFAIWLLFLVPVLLNIIDIGVYIFRKMQVQSAAQMGAQAALAKCGAPTTCSVSGDVTTAVQSTSLGAAVTVSSFTISQYCPDSTGNDATNSLVAQTTTCSTTTSTGTSPGYYAKVVVSYTISPIFGNVTAAALLPSPITQTSWSRIS